MKYIITAGGTGGHINPAIDLSNELIKQGHEVVFVASKNVIDYDILDKCDFEVKHLYLKGFSRSKHPVSLMKSGINMIALMKVMAQSYFLIKKTKPDYIIGFGGFITFPILQVGAKLGVKTAIHEQNSYPGLANRKANSFVKKVFYTYESSKKYFTESKLVYTSNPVIDKASNYVCENKQDYVVFIGGSQGAEKINELAVEFSEISQTKTYLLAGKRYASNYNNTEFLEVIDYLDEPYNLLAKANLVVARGGATTLLELVALKANALIIPSPNVVNDHQNTNALELKSKGLVDVFNENEVTVEDIINQYKKPIDTSFEIGIESIKTIIKELNE